MSFRHWNDYTQRGLNMLNWNNLLTALAETAGTTGTAAGTDTAAQTGSMISTVILLVLMVAFFYFVMIRPQRKKDKKSQGNARCP